MPKVTTEQDAEREHAIAKLREWIEPGQRISTVTIHGRGSTDWIEVFLPSTYEGKPTVERATYYVARAIGYFGSLEKGIALRGYQYSKSTEVVGSLATVLFGDAQALVRDDVLKVSAR